MNEIIDEDEEAKEDKRKSFTMLNHCVQFVVAFVCVKRVFLRRERKKNREALFLFRKAGKNYEFLLVLI